MEGSCGTGCHLSRIAQGTSQHLDPRESVLSDPGLSRDLRLLCRLYFSTRLSFLHSCDRSPSGHLARSLLSRFVTSGLSPAQISHQIHCNYAAIRKLLKIKRRERKGMV